MSYQVLARKWRPQTFDSLIGQEPIVTALRNALSEGRIAQAYLFSGIRGVGKTTAARLLAKALNCEQGPTATPCNECRPCLEITRGSDMDVLEVDAATYSKVEQVRELTESLRYGSARDRYKVVVLDEIHRLSRQAFDALLKIVEEPPPHLVFIFATTEIEAVPVTILSRCQEFHFRRVPSDVVADHLRRLAGEEDIEASDTSLRLIARAGEGSVRDAVALLDQLATFGSGTISDDEAVRLLGGLDVELFRTLLEAIAGGRTQGVRDAVARVEDEGWDPRNVYSQFLAYARDGLHLAMGGEPERIDLPTEEAHALAELARGVGYENLLRMMHQLLAAEMVVRRSEAGALALEIAWLRAAELPKLTRVEELLAGGAPASGRSPSPPPAPRPGESSRSSRSAAESTASTPPPASSPAETPSKPAAPQPSPAAAPARKPGGDARAVVEEVGRLKQPLAALLEECRLHFDGDVLHIRPKSGDTLLEERLERSSNRRVLEDALSRVRGDGAAWKLEASAPAAETDRPEPEAPSAAEAPQAAPDDASDDPTVQRMLDLFGGRVEAVEPRGTSGPGSSDDEPQG